MNVHPKLEGLLVPCGDLVIDPKNARKHPKSQVEALAVWMVEHALNQPIVLDGKKVIKGNGILMAFRHLGWEQIPAVEYTGKSPREFAIVDNRSAELSSWDIAILKDELNLLENLDVSSLGFQTTDLTNLGIDLAALSAGLTDGIQNIGQGTVEGDEEARGGTKVFMCPRCGKRFSG